MFKFINFLEWFFRLSVLMYFIGGFKFLGINPLTDTEGWLYTLVFFNLILAAFFLLMDYKKLFIYQKIINLIEKEATYISIMESAWGDDLKRAELNLEKATIAKNKELVALKYQHSNHV
jgi:hypothetical protein